MKFILLFYVAYLLRHTYGVCCNLMLSALSQFSSDKKVLFRNFMAILVFMEEREAWRLFFFFFFFFFFFIYIENSLNFFREPLKKEKKN